LRRGDGEGVEKSLRDAKVRLSEFSHETMGDYLAELRDGLREELQAVTARREARAERLRGAFEAARARETEGALKAFPWLKDRESAQFKEAAAVLGQFPWVRQYPTYLWFLGDYVDGKRARESRAAVAPRVAPLKTRQPGAPGSVPSVPKGKAAKLEAASRKVLESPSHESLREYLAEAIE